MNTLEPNSFLAKLQDLEGPWHVTDQGSCSAGRRIHVGYRVEEVSMIYKILHYPFQRTRLETRSVAYCPDHKGNMLKE